MIKTRDGIVIFLIILTGLHSHIALSSTNPTPFVRSNSNKKLSSQIHLKSQFSVSETITRVEKILKKKGMLIFSRINHKAAAKRVNLDLRDTELIIFGNPKIGTLLMQSKQTMGLDLPLKYLAWKDDNGQVWLSYEDPREFIKKYGINNKSHIIKRIQKALAKIPQEALLVRRK